ncbi:hypothetical protein BC940DRAFT_299457 [Gongronella butleri]|nr:hypothetical protein BC940DRAFT_299457 [Gongronella butleri]
MSLFKRATLCIILYSFFFYSISQNAHQTSAPTSWRSTERGAFSQDYPNMSLSNATRSDVSSTGSPITSTRPPMYSNGLAPSPTENLIHLLPLPPSVRSNGSSASTPPPARVLQAKIEQVRHEMTTMNTRLATVDHAQRSFGMHQQHRERI